MRFLSYIFARVLPRTLFLLAATTFGSVALMRGAPGYYSDVRELDSQTGSSVRRALEQERSKNEGTILVTYHWIQSALRGDLGESRQFKTPVSQLLAEREATSRSLLFTGLGFGWAAACTLSILLAFVKKKSLHVLCLVPTAWLLALPAGALAMLCFLTDIGGPVLVMGLLVGAREVQFFQRLFNHTLEQPHFLYLRAAGVRATRIVWACVVPQLLPQFLALLLRSFLTAIGLLVPVEVIFDLPGLGQLAWSATMNRDMPVLVALTVLFAGGLAFLGMIADFSVEAERA